MNSFVNILIIDDAMINIEVVRHILSENYLNYHFSIATSGKEALEIVKIKKFTLILLDIVMPEMDGFDVCMALKSDPLTKDIPIIFLTASTDLDSIKKAFSLGAVDYITKPFLNAELVARVGTHVTLSRAIMMLKEHNLDLESRLEWESVSLFQTLES